MRVGAQSSARDVGGRLALVREQVTTAATLAHERTLPLAEGLAEVVPGGALQRGSTLSVNGPGATSFSLALLSAAVQQGSFLAVVAPSRFSLAACLDAGIPLRRVVRFDLGEVADWTQAVGALLDGFDLILLADRQRVSAGDSRRLVARNRERQGVVVRCRSMPWAEQADVRFDLAEPHWSGLGRGHGHLRSRQVSVQVAARRHGAPQSHLIVLPGADGQVARVQAPPAAITGYPRYAGSDIDDMLDAVDGPVPTLSADEAEGAGVTGATEGERPALAAVPDEPELDAIA